MSVLSQYAFDSGRTGRILIARPRLHCLHSMQHSENGIARHFAVKLQGILR